MKSILLKIREIFRNKWFMFGLVGSCYFLWVVWMDSYLLLLGLGVIFDMYITKRVPWAFWKLFKPKSKFGKKVIEWVDAIIFAVIAASFIRLFFFEAYTIPTPSMEKSLLVGDYLFVSKYDYGPRLPNTPIAFPFVHHTLPLTKSTPSFLTWIENDYVRKPGLAKIKNDDVVVFNFPEGDTVIAQYQEQSYYQVCREIGRQAVWNNYDILVRPVDKQENYVKRCVGIAGDTIKIVNGQLFVNGVAQHDLETRQFNYLVVTNGSEINPMILDEMKICESDRHLVQPGYYIMPMVAENAARLKTLSNVVEIRPYFRQDGEWAAHIFPHDSTYKWNEDFFGPLYIPKKGATINLDTKNLLLYRRAIETYEKNKVRVEGNTIYINEKVATTYTFKMDYFWMMGDNRHNSADSRFWGFVPEDHVVGKASMVWLSFDKEKFFPLNIRWSRMFRTIHD